MDATRNDGPIDYRARIVVKFRDDVMIPYEDGAERHIDRLGIGSWEKLAQQFPGVQLRPLFQQIGTDALQELVQRAVTNDDEYRPPNFFSYFIVTCPLDVDPERLIEPLRSWRSVQEVYAEAGPTPPPAVNALDDPRSVNQGYLDAAPDGVDAEYAWTKPAGDGTGVGFVDLEQGWTLNHEDLAAANIALISGTSSAYFGHGTSVLGEVVAVDNALGGVGIAPQATARVVSQFQPTGYSTPSAIISAISVMAFGDVLLLEAQTTVAGINGYAPVEVETAVFDAIRLATALGIVVVEAGANGSVDLDAVTVGGQQILNRASAGFRDSGAILVGAASSTVPHAPMSFTNFGSRIDCYAWGQNIDTTGDGWTGTTTTAYTSNFGGTSGASPIISGAALLLQSISQAVNGYRFSPRQIRRILSDPATGTASASPGTDRIGVMPDLKKIVNATLGVSDIYLRDFVGDTGEPHNGAVSASPDVILRPTPVANPQASFGAGSGTENDATLGYEAEAGQDNTIYVRVLNQGSQPATNVTATVYWSPVSTLVTPNLWTLVGSVTLPTVPLGEILTVSGAITWPAAAVPAPGHYCFVALIGTADDPAPAPQAFLNWTNFQNFIKNNNNVTWRNFNVVDNVPPSQESRFIPLPFLMAGAPDRGRVFDIEVVGRLPEGARLMLELPAALAGRLRAHHLVVDGEVPGFGREPDPENKVIVVAPHGSTRFADVLLAAAAAFPCRLFADVPEDARKGSYRVYVRQLYKNEEVGRVTWLLAPPRDSDR